MNNDYGDHAVEEPASAARASSNKGCLIALIVGGLIIVGIVAVIVIGGGDRVIRAMEILRGEPQKSTVQVTPGELVPVLNLVVEEFHVTVHTKRTGPVLGGMAQSLPRHIIANGTITACFNLEDRASQFQVQNDPNDPEHVTVTLPAPQYCSAAIDNAEYFDEAGVGVPATNDINGLLLEDAKKQLYTAADSQHLLQQAQDRGADQIKEMLYKLGFKKVDVNFSAPVPVQ